MFATLLGALPRPPLGDDAPLEALVEAAMRAQEAAGLEPITDGGGPGEGGLVGRWRATAALTDRAVKQAITGPFSEVRGAATPGPATGRLATGRLATSGAATTAARSPASALDRRAATLAAADRLNATLRELAAAGCPLIEVHEPAATAIGADPDERALFRDAQARLLEGLTGTHISLAVVGGSADTAGIETILAAPYASLAVDLIAGPDNWRLVVAAPRERGIVCGALPTAAGSDDGPETLLWAAGYAASTAGRGPARVGLAPAGSLAHLSWAAAVAKMAALGEAVRLFGLPADERARSLDPRAVSSRSAALGRVDPPPSHGPDRGDDPT